MNLKEVRYNGEKFPSVFYIGMGKTGSSALYYGIKNRGVAHWHDSMYFYRLHNLFDLGKDKINVYQFILNTCKQYDIKPIFIESVREPIAQRISWYFQLFKNATATQVIHAMQSDDFTFEFNHFKEGMDDEIDPILLKYEEINLWQMQLALHGIDFELKHTNKRNNPEYKKAKENLKLPYEKLKWIYKQPAINIMYSEKEINKFIERWTL